MPLRFDKNERVMCINAKGSKTLTYGKLYTVHHSGYPEDMPRGVAYLVEKTGAPYYSNDRFARIVHTSEGIPNKYSRWI